MMIDVQDFIETPGSKDVRVSDVFTQKMFDELKTEMQVRCIDIATGSIVCEIFGFRLFFLDFRNFSRASQLS